MVACVVMAVLIVVIPVAVLYLKDKNDQEQEFNNLPSAKVLPLKM